MSLPTSVIEYAERWNVLDSGSTSAAIGTQMPIAMTNAISAIQPLRGNSAARGGRPSAKPSRLACSSGCGATSRFAETLGVFISNLGAAALQGEHTLRTLLDEQHDQHEHRDLREHRAPERLDRLADKPQSKAADYRSRQLPDAAQHHRHERIDDVALSEVRPDIADLRERATAQSRDACAEGKRIRIHACGFYTDARGHAAVLSHGAHEQAQTRLGQHDPREQHDDQ